MALVLKTQQRQFKKIERVEARLNPDQKRRIEYAANLKGTSISDFMVSSADDAAVRAIEQHEVRTLTGRDKNHPGSNYSLRVRHLRVVVPWRRY